MAKRQKHEYIQRELAAKGFTKLPCLSLMPTGAPVTVLTNCCIYPFDETAHARTDTKTYYEPTSRTHLMNVTAAVAIRLIERGQQVIMHVPTEIEERMRGLISLHDKASLCHIVTGNIYDWSILEKVYDAAANLSQHASISRIDFCLYDSYASGLARPFLPMFEDDPAVAGRLATQRTNFLFHFSMMAYDLLTRCHQGELRLVCPTALATKRPSSHLFTDTIHKAVSNVLLRTLGYELPYYCEKPARIVEVAPGIVDTGLYDDASIRQATYEESMMDGFALESGVEPSVFPMMSIEALAQVCLGYLCADTDDELSEYANETVLNLTYAGRSPEVLREAFEQLVRTTAGGSTTLSRELPEYCYTPGTVFGGGLPSIRSGYIPVMLTPRGQLF